MASAFCPDQGRYELAQERLILALRDQQPATDWRSRTCCCTALAAQGREILIRRLVAPGPQMRLVVFY